MTRGLSASQNQLVVCLLHILNAIFAVSGIALSIGILVAYVLQLQGSITATESPSTLWVLIVLGLFIACTAFLGLCGICIGNKCFLTLYVAIVTAIFIVQLVLAILVYRDSLGVDQFWLSVGDRLGMPIYVLLFIMCLIEAVVIVFSCTLICSQRRRRLDERLHPTQAVIPMQQQYYPGPPQQQLYSPPHGHQHLSPPPPAVLVSHTGTPLQGEQQFVEYVEEERLNNSNAQNGHDHNGAGEEEYQFEELDPQYMQNVQQQADMQEKRSSRLPILDEELGSVGSQNMSYTPHTDMYSDYDPDAPTAPPLPLKDTR